MLSPGGLDGGTSQSDHLLVRLTLLGSRATPELSLSAVPHFDENLHGLQGSGFSLSEKR